MRSPSIAQLKPFSLGLALALSIAGIWGGPALIGQPASGAWAQTDAIASRILELQSSSERWIEVDLSRQRLIAWEGNQPVYAVIVSTGTASHPTLTGTFAIQTRLRTARMRGEGYDVPDVPYTMYYDGNYAIHGAYWHNQFGTPVSHGCINVAVDHAEWLYSWASVGTPVVVHE